MSQRSSSQLSSRTLSRDRSLEDLREYEKSLRTRSRASSTRTRASTNPSRHSTTRRSSAPSRTFTSRQSTGEFKSSKRRNIESPGTSDAIFLTIIKSNPQERRLLLEEYKSNQPLIRRVNEYLLAEDVRKGQIVQAKVRSLCQTLQESNILSMPLLRRLAIWLHNKKYIDLTPYGKVGLMTRGQLCSALQNALRDDRILDTPQYVLPAWYDELNVSLPGRFFGRETDGGKLMKNPVSLPDGTTYDWSTLERDYIHMSGVDPDSSHAINTNLRVAIDDWLIKNVGYTIAELEKLSGGGSGSASDPGYYSVSSLPFSGVLSADKTQPDIDLSGRRERETTQDILEDYARDQELALTRPYVRSTNLEV